MSDVSAISLAVEIVQAAMTNGDSRRKGEKITSSEVEEIFIKAMSQSCTSLTPDNLKGTLSYLNPNLEQLSSQHFCRDWRYGELIPDAISSVMPILLDAGNGFVPNARDFLLNNLVSRHSRGWKCLPAYPPIPVLFPEKSGFKPWFAVFSDTIGNFLYFYYPEEPQGIIEIPYVGIDLMGFKIYWRHGTPGLSDILQWIYLEWVIRTYICWGQPEGLAPDAV